MTPPLAARSTLGRRWRPDYCLGFAILFAAFTSTSSAQNLTITNVHLAGHVDVVSIGISAGRITAIGETVASESIPRLDGRGGHVIPGLIDSHVHLGVVPGAELRGDDDATLLEQRRAQLRAYLAAGVTTVLDTGIPSAVLQDLRSQLAAGFPGPRLLTTGEAFATPGGYVSKLAIDMPVVETVADVEAHFERLEKLGVFGAKVPIEDGFGPDPVWPLPSSEIRAAITSGAAKRNMPILVHGTAEHEQLMGLEMGAQILVHIGFAEEPPSAAFIERAVSSGVYMITTFSIFDAWLLRFDTERLESKLYRRLIPDLQFDTARSKDAGDAYTLRSAALSAPGLPSFLQKLIAWAFLREGSLRSSRDATLTAALALYRAGVPLVIGSDAGSWPVNPFNFHGPTTIREMELLVRAGLSPNEVLDAATLVPAKMLGLESEIGAIEVGRRADLVILAEDPRQDIGALADVLYTIKGGVAKSPKAWLASLRPIGLGEN